MVETSDVLVERLARRLSEMKLATPAVAFLQVNMPLSFVGSQLLLLFQPALDVFVDRKMTGEWAEFLADRDRVEGLIDRLKATQ